MASPQLKNIKLNECANDGSNDDDNAICSSSSSSGISNCISTSISNKLSLCKNAGENEKCNLLLPTSTSNRNNSDNKINNDLKPFSEHIELSTTIISSTIDNDIGSTNSNKFVECYRGLYIYFFVVDCNVMLTQLTVFKIDCKIKRPW